MYIFLTNPRSTSYPSSAHPLWTMHIPMCVSFGHGCQKELQKNNTPVYPPPYGLQKASSLLEEHFGNEDILHYGTLRSISGSHVGGKRSEVTRGTQFDCCSFELICYIFILSQQNHPHWICYWCVQYITIQHVWLNVELENKYSQQNLCEKC